MSCFLIFKHGEIKKNKNPTPLKTVGSQNRTHTGFLRKNKPEKNVKTVGFCRIFQKNHPKTGRGQSFSQTKENIKNCPNCPKTVGFFNFKKN